MSKHLPPTKRKVLTKHEVPSRHEEYLICQKRKHHTKFSSNSAGFYTCEYCGTLYTEVPSTKILEENVPVPKGEPVPEGGWMMAFEALRGVKPVTVPLPKGLKFCWPCMVYYTHEKCPQCQSTTDDHAKGCHCNACYCKGYHTQPDEKPEECDCLSAKCEHTEAGQAILKEHKKALIEQIRKKYVPGIKAWRDIHTLLKEIDRLEKTMGTMESRLEHEADYIKMQGSIISDKYDEIDRLRDESPITALGLSGELLELSKVQRIRENWANSRVGRGLARTFLELKQHESIHVLLKEVKRLNVEVGRLVMKATK